MWFKTQDQKITLFILAKPHAKKTAFLAVSDQGLSVALHAKPIKGAANKELTSYLAKIFRLPKNQVFLQLGEGSKHKRVIVPLTAVTQRFLDDPISFNQLK